MFHDKLFMFYHEYTIIKLTAEEDMEVSLGIPPVDIKTGTLGYNHNDLGYGALLNFLSWPPREKIFLSKGKTLIINPFSPYRPYGNCSISPDTNDKVKFLIPSKMAQPRRSNIA